jgi:hypothetical protein
MEFIFMVDLPVTCTVSPDGVKRRSEALLSDLLGRADEHDELYDGHRLRFASARDTLPLIGRAVEAVRECCRFLRVQISVEPDGGPIWLALTGPSGTSECVSALLE